jgi:Tryptophan synthase alpha chain
MFLHAFKYNIALITSPGRLEKRYRLFYGPWTAQGGQKQRAYSSCPSYGYYLRSYEPEFSTHSCKIGYYNPLLAYGEDKAIQDAADAGANGFIMVDLPPEEALTFREKCTKAKCV